MNDKNNNLTGLMWLAILALSLGGFTIVTTELAPIGLLSQMSSDLNTSNQKMGMIVSLYAWVGAIAALLGATLLGHYPRKKSLLILMLVLTISNVLAAQSQWFYQLMTARVIGALSHGVFWTLIGIVVTKIVPTNKVGLATAVVFGGVSAASVFGVPLANLIGEYAGWRSAFILMGILAFTTMLAICWALPKIAPEKGVTKQALIRVIANPRLQTVFFITVAGITAHFMTFTYIEPFLSREMLLSNTLVVTLLFTFGVAGLATNFAIAVFIDKYLKTILFVNLTIFCLSLLGLALISPQQYWLIGAIMVLWGCSYSSTIVCLQTWVLKEAREDALPASAILVALFNLAIGTGAMLGAVVITCWGLKVLFFLAAILVFCCLLIFFFRREKYQGELANSY